jgi:plastocyanin
MNKRIILIVLALMITPLVLAACGGGGSASGTSIQAKMTDFAFSPNQWQVPAGKTITLTLTNNGSVEHSWVLMKSPVTPPFGEKDQSNIIFSTKVAAGATSTVTFTAPSAPGEYEVICDIPGHLEAGMDGKLVVTQ